MFRLFNLSGELSGTVILDSSCFETRFEFRPRRGGEAGGAFTAYIVNGADIVPCAVENGRGRAAIGDGRGAVIVREGRVVGFGASDMTDADLNAAAERVRLMLFSKEQGDPPENAKGSPPVKTTEPPQIRRSPAKAEEQGKNGPAAPRSEAAKQILRTAQELFSRPTGETENPIEACETAPRETEVPNPFPRQFPGSYWFTLPGDPAVYGRVSLRGRPCRAVALPAESTGAQRRRVMRRRVRGADGREYLLEIDPGSPV